MKQRITILILVFFFIFISWTWYRITFQFPEWVDELVGKPLLMLLPVLVAVCIIEKRKVSSVGLIFTNFWRDSIIGCAVGVFLAAEKTLIWSMRTVRIEQNLQVISALGLLVGTVEPTCTSIVEEIVFRGYLITRLKELGWKDWAAYTVSTVLFVLIHVPLALFVYHYGGGELFGYCTLIFLLGFANALVFGYTGSLTAPIIMHWVWNYSNFLYP
jgi:membrane protease YdiL (CAAX protease family)